MRVPLTNDLENAKSHSRHAQTRRTVWNVAALAAAAIMFVGIAIVSLRADAAEPNAHATAASSQTGMSDALSQETLRHALPLGGLVVALAVIAVQLGKPPKR